MTIAITISSFRSYDNESSVVPNTLTQSYALLRRKSGIMLKCLEHESNRQVFADLLIKGLPPSVLGEHTVDMGFMV